ncbi:phage baseplate protein [Acetobacter tropicalis]|uniref:phage baseplate protein n=1 Tax=Acetobacter tropicalis TaxID=104102 RepID=UPI003975880D
MPLPSIGLPALWDIPVAAGVPALLGQSVSTGIAASASTILATALDEYTITSAASQWGIFTASNQPVLTSSHVRALEVRREEMVTDSPIEEGGFMSYNKVTRPTQIRLQIICDGSSFSYGDASAVTDLLSSFGLSGASSGLSVRETFAKALDSLVADLNQYHVNTPEKTYLNMNVVGYGMRRSSESGITMLMAEIDLQEIRPVSTGTLTKTIAPSGEGKSFSGTVAPQTATSAQAAAVGGAS